MKATFALLPVLAAASPLLGVGTIHKDAAPILTSVNAAAVQDSYIIVFKDHVTHEHAKAHHEWVQGVHTSRMDLRKRSQVPFIGDVFKGLRHTYNLVDGIMGYSGHFDPETIEEIRRHPDVEYIERDQEVHALESPAVEKQAPWGLARISHREGLGFGNFNKYLYAADAGEGVDVYVIDTGTNIGHVDFEGRAKWEATIPDGDKDEDGNGHGTHCSGTVAGKKYGVAKKANIRAIKVLRSNGSGTMSDVISGVERAAQAHLKEKKKGRKGFKGSAANMSLGGGKSPSLDKTVNAAVAAGIHFAVAAGNDNADSCNYSPAAAADAVTVGASNFEDDRAYFSNYGKCNDIFAPGLDITSTWIGSKYAVNTISGTSMASPHIAGLLAYMLSLQPDSDSAYAVPDITPKKLKANLLSIATKNALSDVPSSTSNLLAFNGAGSSNYSDIIRQGGVDMGKKAVPAPIEVKLPTADQIEDDLELLSELVEEEYNLAVEELESARAKLASKTKKLTAEVKQRLADKIAAL